MAGAEDLLHALQAALLALVLLLCGCLAWMMAPPAAQWLHDEVQALLIRLLRSA